MKDARFHPDALAEYDEAIGHYAQEDAALGRRFREAAEATRDRACAMPKIYAEDDNTGCREALIRGFPYSVHYIEFDDYIWVLAVAHQRRRPGYWLRRLRDR